MNLLFLNIYDVAALGVAALLVALCIVAFLKSDDDD